ncbi:hypothetical protein [Deinococcus peraridilitoris]|uniref:Uncharacterized protein n=1 Tax=Deinococcus peraridilitoris (strain DSM 19664 / LMG 22246 / CIP 109416 / KR-200) TaxID=937777 RepID=L0A1U5_DEIPD|nr:hypothetical protein [Deinococcus peraridilitoris]AFZ67117.1 hypothetical protein Deipe_1576 [Deinococcus peraridilitoris DSM 19664]
MTQQFPMYAIFTVEASRAEVKDTHHAGWVAKYTMSPVGDFPLLTMLAAKKADGLKLVVKHRERTYDEKNHTVPATLHGNTTIHNKDGTMTFPVSVKLDELHAAGIGVDELLRVCDLRLECTADGSTPAQPSLDEIARQGNQQDGDDEEDDDE